MVATQGQVRQARRVREWLGLSLAEVQKAIGFEPSHLSPFERGVRDMRGDHLCVLRDYYNTLGAGVTVDDLLAPAPPDPSWRR